MRTFAREHPVERMKHEAVAAESNQSLRLFEGGEAVALHQQLFRGLRGFAVRRQEADPEAG
jgi:hypothetical protein